MKRGRDKTQVVAQSHKRPAGYGGTTSEAVPPQVVGPSGRKEPVEERPVAGERDAEVLRRNVVALRPLGFEALALLGEGRREALHQVGDERVGLLDRALRLVD